MTELGGTDDPRRLVPGNPEAIAENVRVLRARAKNAEHAADGLKAIDSGSWQGAAARAFHDKFSYEPGRWLTSADCLEAGADALDNYTDTLSWAQREAGEAIHLWDKAQQATQQAQAKHEEAVAEASAQNQPAPPFVDPGAEDRPAARDMLNRARTQLDEAGEVAAGILRGETRPAPEESNWLEEFGEEVGDAGATVVNGAASFGNAAIHHPGTLLAGLGGAALTGVSAVGEVAGVTLDATGVGAIGGVPLGGISTAGMATGIGLTGAAVANMASEAAGDDHVEAVEASDETLDEVTPTGEATQNEVPKEINGYTDHGYERAMGREGRGVNDEAMHDAVENPVREPMEQSHPQGTTYRYEGKNAVVVLNGSGEVVSTWATNRSGVRNPL